MSKKGELILILGGARSGKSAFAERLAAARSKVLFVATAQALDGEMRRRIAAHKGKRPPSWATLEEPLEVAAALERRARGYDTVVLDCLTLWVSNLMLRERSEAKAERETLVQAQRLAELWAGGTATWIVVTNEVGLGIVPPTKLARCYRDLLGKVNQVFATRADRVYLMVAGLALDVKAAGGKPFAQLSDRTKR
jgi:adenosyl cobinamide kinase/adenosyl cobinamide phosphate guanylyltransferase